MGKAGCQLSRMPHSTTGQDADSVALLQEAHVPVYLYNFPANTGGLVDVDLYASLASEFSQLKGVKNTFDDLPLSKRFKAAVPGNQV